MPRKKSAPKLEKEKPAEKTAAGQMAWIPNHEVMVRPVDFRRRGEIKALLEELFAQFGPDPRTEIAQDTETPHQIPAQPANWKQCVMGIAYVTMKDEVAANTAARELDGKNIGGNNVWANVMESGTKPTVEDVPEQQLATKSRLYVLHKKSKEDSQRSGQPKQKAVGMMRKRLRKGKV